MREILFRGKKTISGEWVEGAFSKYNWNVLDERKEKPQIIIFSDNEDIDGLWCGVLPETVGQYTGLTDKNGRKIFEGDIIRLTDKHNEIEWTAVVVFGNPNGEYNWGWQLKAIGEFDGNKDILLWVDMEESGAYCEVIGNIYDKKLEDFENGC